MGLIDSHAHLTFPQLIEKVDEVLQRSRDAGVDRVITIGTTLADSMRAAALARRYQGLVYASAGIHPHESETVTDADFSGVAKLWEQTGVVAVGEVGLDYHYNFADPRVQRSVFSRQLELAARRDLPLIVHCREALHDALPLLVDHGFAQRRVVFHCFTGTADDALRIAEQGWRISFTGIVTFVKSTGLSDIAKAYPVDELMIETDSPYLSPIPVRGKTPNEPAHLVHTARFLAGLRGTPYEEFVERTARNTERFFGLTCSVGDDSTGCAR